MTTARTLIKGALRLIRVVDSTEEPEAEEMADALLAMNQMIHGWENEGIYTDYEDVKLTDDMPFPNRDLKHIRYLLAAELAAEWGRQMSPEVAVQAREGKETLQAHYGIQPESKPDLSIQNRLSRYGNVYNIKTDGV